MSYFEWVCITVQPGFPQILAFIAKEDFQNNYSLYRIKDNTAVKNGYKNMVKATLSAFCRVHYSIKHLNYCTVPVNR